MNVKVTDDEAKKFYYFFFSSRRRHTRVKCDWSSDVCSSDLLGKWVHRPDRDLAVEAMEETHAREAGLGDLSGADRVIGARGLAAALGVEPRIALAKADEVGLHPVGDAEIEVPAMRDLKE